MFFPLTIAFAQKLHFALLSGRRRPSCSSCSGLLTGVYMLTGRDITAMPSFMQFWAW